MYSLEWELRWKCTAMTTTTALVPAATYTAWHTTTTGVTTTVMTSRETRYAIRDGKAATANVVRSALTNYKLLFRISRFIALYLKASAQYTTQRSYDMSNPHDLTHETIAWLTGNQRLSYAGNLCACWRHACVTIPVAESCDRVSCRASRL